MNKLSMGVFRCSSVSEILKYIRAITSHRAPIRYGVEKVEGKSYDRLRREANQKAIDLLNSLVDGATLTDEQRQIGWVHRQKAALAGPSPNITHQSRSLKVSGRS